MVPYTSLTSECVRFPGSLGGRRCYDTDFCACIDQILCAAILVGNIKQATDGKAGYTCRRE